MTELEYVLDGFEKKLSCLKGKRILLHGSREYATEITRRYSEMFLFAGIMSAEPIEGNSISGIPVFQEEEFDNLGFEAVLLTERVKYAEAVYQAIHERCEERDILLYNMYGVDELKTHKEIDSCCSQLVIEWKARCKNYDLVVFETMDTFFSDYKSEGEYVPRDSLFALLRWLLSRNIAVKFSLRKSYPEEKQIKLIEKLSVFKDPEAHVIRRRGEDLSFRKLREDNPEKRILYIGMGLVNECLLPRCYGIDTYRFVPSDIRLSSKYSSQNNWYLSLGDESEKNSYFNQEREETVRQRIRDSEIVSFDVFDTLIQRRTLVPWDVFELLEKRLKERGTPIDGLAKARKAEGESHENHTIYEIYERLGNRYGWSEDFLSEVLELELKIEREVITPREEVVELLYYALQEKKQVALVSDMYLPAIILEPILNDCGICRYDTLLVSCDCQKDKRSGLFEELIQRFGQGKKILHIGDDPQADGKAGEFAGTSVVLLPSALALANSHGWQYSIVAPNTLMERCLVGMCVAEVFRDPFQNPNIRDLPLEKRLTRFAVSVIGPLSVGFLTWLVCELRSTPFDGVLFLARDGFFLQKIYQLLHLKRSLPPSFYYYTSRHSAFLCCSNQVDKISVALKQAENTKLGAADALREIYDIPEAQIKHPLEDELDDEYILRHMSEISPKAEESRIASLFYSNLVGLKQNGVYAVVDCIAAGTTQWLMESWMPYRFQGFYLGNCNPAGRNSAHIKDYLRFQNNSILKNYIELEGFFSSAEPSVRTIAPSGTVVFSKEKREAEEIENLLVVQNVAKQFAQTFFELFYSENEVIDPEVPEELFAADGCHWVKNSAYDDWTGSKIPTKKWENGEREDV